MRLIVPDPGTLGLLTHPLAQPDALACRQWAQARLAAGIRVTVPGIADYELRRELIRAGKTPGLHRLDAVRAGFEFDPITQTSLDQAAALDLVPRAVPADHGAVGRLAPLCFRSSCGCDGT